MHWTRGDDVAVTPPVIATLILIVGINPAVLHLFLPALPELTRDLGVDISTAQLTVSLALLAMAVATLIYGPLSDAFGRRPVLLGATALIIAGSLLAVAAPNIIVLILARMLQACGAAVGPVLARTVVFDLFGDKKAGPAMAKIIIGMVLVTMTAPAVGGVLAEYVGWRANFGAILVLGLLLGFAVVYFLPETHSGAATRSIRIGQIAYNYARILREPAFYGYGLQVAFTMAIVYSFMSAAPYIMVSMFDRPASEFGYYLFIVAAGYVAGNAVTARITPNIGSHRIIFVGCVLALLACILLAALLLFGFWRPWAIFAPAAVAAFGGGLSLPNSEAAVVGVVPALGGSASSLTSCFVLVVSAVFAQAVGGALVDTPHPLGGAMIIASALALLAYVWGISARKPPASTL